MSPTGAVDAGVYEALITAVANAGYDPTFVPYDWRLSIQVLAAAFVRQLRSAALTNPFQVIAHSMGGLVALLAYAQYKPGPSDPVWSQTVYVATPFGGSFDAVASGAGIGTPFEQYSLWFNSFGLLGQNPDVLNRGVHTLSTRIKRTMASWPSLFEMLPGSLAPWNALHGDTGRFYRLENWATANPFVTQAILDNASGTQGLLRDAAAAPQPLRYFVVGGGVYTRTGLKVGGAFDDAAAYTKDRGGDHVVPSDFATLSGGEDLSVFGDHSDMLSQLPFLGELPAILKRTLTVPKQIPEPFKPAVIFPPPMTTIAFPPPAFPSLQRRGDP
jgi:pimeloyl-ACP methyl ester carboxylesterase